MKKRLEAELMSIAHRILKLKGKEDLVQLHKETRKLYESLSILKFVEDNMNVVVPKIDLDEVEQKLEKFLDNQEIEGFEKDNISKLELEIEELRSDLDEIEQKIENTKDTKTVFFGDLILNDYKEPVFEKIEKTEEKIYTKEEELEAKTKIVPIAFEIDETEEIEEEVKLNTIDFEQIKEDNNEKSNTININLNDRIGFVKHLFDDNNEDYIRVLSQLSTFDNFDEAKDFIENMVKPDYNNWHGKEDFEARFMEIIQNKFD